MAADLKELKRLAEAATPGPWKKGSSQNTHRIYADETENRLGIDMHIHGNGNRDDNRKNASFIAAANPAVILDLIAQLEQAQTGETSQDGSLTVDEAVSGVMDLFPTADRQALQCLAELMAKPAAKMDQGKVSGSREAREDMQRQRMKERFANRPKTPSTADFDLPAPNDAPEASELSGNSGELLMAGAQAVVTDEQLLSAFNSAESVIDGLHEVVGLLSTQPAGAAVARLLRWAGPKHTPIPHGGIAARTYAEFSEEEANKPDSYWKNDAPLYTASLPKREAISKLTADQIEDCFPDNGSGTCKFPCGKITVTAQFLHDFAHNISKRCTYLADARVTYCSTKYLSEVQMDADRLEWLMRSISGRALRSIGVTTSGNCDRAAIDAAIAAQSKEQP